MTSSLLRFAHALSFGANSLGLSSEILRAVQEADFLVRRPTSLNYEPCPYFVRGSDLPPSPLFQAITLLWHIMLAILCLLMLLGDIPGKWCTRRMKWNTINGHDVSTWHMGAVQIYIGTSILSVTVGIYGSQAVIMWRFLTGYLMIGIGFISMALGIMQHEDMRMLRGQKRDKHNYKKDVDGERPERNVGKTYFLIDTCLQGAQFHGEVGKLVQAKKELYDAIEDIGGFGED